VSHWAEYMFYRHGFRTIENHAGFLSYKIHEGSLFIAEFFVSKDFQRLGHGKKLVDEMEEIAKKNECKTIFGNIYPNAPGFEGVLMMAIKLGYKIVNAHNGAIIIEKDLQKEGV
jgi:GNAT superfamily N-acetyltransferase